MSWWLNVFFLINGVWVPGHQIDGWSPRAYGSEAECIERKTFAERQCAAFPLTYPAAWICTKDRPLEDVPDHLLPRKC